MSAQTALVKELKGFQFINSPEMIFAILETRNLSSIEEYKSLFLNYGGANLLWGCKESNPSPDSICYFIVWER